MSRSAPKNALPLAQFPAHVALLSVDLAGWAGGRIATGGRRDALIGRVESLRLSLDGRSIEARVRGQRPLPYGVQVWVSGERVLSLCSCSRAEDVGCKHAVAALEALRFPRDVHSAGPGAGSAPRGRRPAGRGRILQPALHVPGFLVVGDGERLATREERIAAARQDELALRRALARRQRAPIVRADPGSAVLSYAVGGPHDLRSTVTLWGPASVGCTCRDFAESELGTCEHIERVRNWRRHRGAREPAPPDGAALWCAPREWLVSVPEPVREIRFDGPGGPPEALAKFFDAEGWLRSPPAGRAASSWAREAVGAAAEQAAGSGAPLAIEGQVGVRIELAAAQEQAGDRLRVAPDALVWRELVNRLGLRLHPYQEEGALFLARSGRGFLADDMGLGKTVQAVAASLLLRSTAGAVKTLVVCPASLKPQWSREIVKICGEAARVVDGPLVGRRQAYAEWRAGFLIVNYELVLRDLDAIVAARPDLVILDEAQRIKNWHAKTARAVKQLPSPYAFVLTGTPLENRLLELHSIVEFLHPRALGPRWRLAPFHVVGESSGRIVAYEGLDVMRQRLSHFFLRRERERVLDQLPGRTDNTFWTELSAAQRRPYRKHATTLARLLASGRPLTARDVQAVLRALTSMRVVCNALAQHDWDRFAARLARPTPPTPAELRALGSPKLLEFVRVLEDLLDESGQKLVVFSQWERMLRLAHFVAGESLARRDLRADVFHGGLASRAREAMLAGFLGDPEFRVLFSTDAGGLGLNLQDAASIVINLEVPWNPAVVEQRVGRVHRLGQRRSVQVLHFVTRGAIEERVRHVLESKRALFDGLLVDGAERVELDAAAHATFLERVRVLIEPLSAGT